MRGGDYLEITSSGLFSASWYLERYPDVAAAGIDPLKHYLRHGVREGRDPGPVFSTASYLARYREELVCSGLNPLLHYLRHGRQAGYDPSPLTAARGYRNFAEFLQQSLLSPLMAAPFSTTDRTCFAAMADITRQLCDRQEATPYRPLVSVIMPMHNRANLVAAAIASVLGQTYRDFELIVVDDGSDDGSADVVRATADSRIQLVECRERGGVSAARNRGLLCANGEMIAYLDSDNSWRPDYLKAMIGAFQALPDADALYCGQFLYRGDDPEPFAMRFAAFNPSLLRNINYIDLNCFMHRRTILEQLDSWFCQELRRLVDWEFISRIAAKTAIYSIPVVQSNYHLNRTADTITSSENLEVALSFLKRQRENEVTASQPHQERKLTVIAINSLPESEKPRYVEELSVAIGASAHLSIINLDKPGRGASFWTRGKNWIQGPSPRLSQLLNRAIAGTTAGSDLLFLCNGALPEPGTLPFLQAVVNQSEDIAAVIPQLLLPQGNFGILAHVPQANPASACDIALSLNYEHIRPLPEFHRGETVEINGVLTDCLFVKNKAWEIFGGFRAEGDHLRDLFDDFCKVIKETSPLKIVYSPKAAVRLHTIKPI